MTSRKQKLSGRPAIKKRSRGRPSIYSRADILAAAKSAFSKSGYANVSLDQLAARLRTKKGSLYYHSSRKVDLLTQITRAFIIETAKEVSRIAAMKAPPEQRFAWAMRAHMSSVLSDVQASKIYFENESDIPPKIKAEFRKVLRDIHNTFVSLAVECCEVGFFKKDPSLAVYHTMAIANWPYRWFADSGELSADAFIENAIEFALLGLAGSRSDLKRLARSKMPSPQARIKLRPRTKLRGAP
jgi:AcrR family transcriptional regulator